MKTLAIIPVLMLSAIVSLAQSAVLTPQEDTYDFGMVKAGGRAEHIFFYNNTGTLPLQITDVKDDCSCTKVNWAAEALPSGYAAAMIVSVNTEQLGEKEIKLNITSNGEPKQLTLKINVVSLKTTIPATAAPNPPGN